ncbi:uncharacterized protein VSU04_011660 isoform 4-T5 [Chlamydotis macqueenii]
MLSGSSSKQRAEYRLPPFHCGRPFFCPESTRGMERIYSGLQVQGTSTRCVSVFPKASPKKLAALSLVTRVSPDVVLLY